jgi:hypothetical protein
LVDHTCDVLFMVLVATTRNLNWILVIQEL